MCPTRSTRYCIMRRREINQQNDELYRITSVRSEIALFLGVLGTISIIGYLDYLTGYYLRIYPLYMVPIGIYAWKTRWRIGGIVVSILAVFSWDVSNFFAGMDIPLWMWGSNSIAHMSAFTVIVVLISHLRRSQLDEYCLARSDALTNLPNSRSFCERANFEIERQKRYRRPMSIAYMDLDNFKVINDRFGHQSGDLLLSSVGNVLMKSIRSTDLIGRLGGDEFALLMPETGAEDALDIIKRVQSLIADEMAAHNWPVTCSIGVVSYYAPPNDYDEMINKADSLMYQIKKEGKNAARLEQVPPDGVQEK